LLERVAIACRRRHFSPRSEESYRYWIRQYIFFHGKRHPEILGEAEVIAFLNHLAVDRKVAASTQSQALNALVFLYSNVLEKPLPEMTGIKRVQHRYRVPVVLTQDEVRAVLGQMKGTPKLMAQLLYGAGLRVTECVTLRVKDIDFGSKAISVRAGQRQQRQNHSFEGIACRKGVTGIEKMYFSKAAGRESSQSTQTRPWVFQPAASTQPIALPLWLIQSHLGFFV